MISSVATKVFFVDQLVGGALKITNDFINGCRRCQLVKDGLRSEQSAEGQVERRHLQHEGTPWRFP